MFRPRRAPASASITLLLMAPGLAAATLPEPSPEAVAPSAAQQSAPSTVAPVLSFLGGLGVGMGVAGVFDRDGVRERMIHCPAPSPVQIPDPAPPPGWADALRQIDTHGGQIARNRGDIDSLHDNVRGVSADLGDVVRFDKDATVHLRGARLVALGAGEISADSHQAITGAQLFAASQRVAALEYTQLYAKVGADAQSLPAQAGHLGTAMGSDARAQGAGSTALGSFTTTLGRNSVALGRAAIVLDGAHDGFALGSRSRVLAENGMALGASAQVWEGAHDSVALGFGSIVQHPFEVSVGGQGMRRRITNVMPGIADDDVVSMRQLSALAGLLGTGVDGQGGVRGVGFTVRGRWHGSVAEAVDALDDAVGAAHDALDSMGGQMGALQAQQVAGDAGPADGPEAADTAPAKAAAPAVARAPKADAAPPAVDTRAVDEAVQRANGYTDQAMASVDRRFSRLDRRMNRMAAMGSAQAAMAMNTAGLPTWNRLGAGIGHADGESALAVGYQRVLERRAATTFSLNGAFSQSGESTVAVGVGIGW